jgi:hypothetical protein
VSRDSWFDRKDADRLGRIMELLAVAELDNREWRGVRAALLEAWPTREDVSDGVQEVGTLHEGPQEADVDVPEV